MSFFEQQRLAKRNSSLLYLLFIGGAIVLSAINTYVFGYIAMILFHQGPFYQGKRSYFLAVFLINMLLFVVSIAKSKKKAENGIDVAEMLGGRMLRFPLLDQSEKRLFDVVEEMSIASGFPTPHIFILENENTINAFAVGIDRKSASVAVTRGALNYLSRDELQAVIAHEFSHIIHEDISINAELTGFVKTFMVFMRIGRSIVDASSRRSKRGGELAIIGVVFLVMGSVGFLIGRIIQSLFSKEREYLADGASAQFTRNPMALAKALAKIKMNYGSELKSANSYDYAHIFFAEGVSRFFSTHPPLEKRIQSLVPSVNMSKLLIEAHGDLQKQEKKIEAKRREEDPLSAVPTAPSQIDDLDDAKAVLLAVLLKNQEEKIKSGYLQHLQSYSLDLHLKTQAYLRNLTNQPRNLTVSLKKALGILRTMNLAERKRLIELSEKIFTADQRWTWLEGLMYELTQEVLIRESSLSQSRQKYNLAEVKDSLAWFLFWAVSNGDGTQNISAQERKSIIYKLSMTNSAFVNYDYSLLSVPPYNPEIARIHLQNLYQLKAEQRGKIIQGLLVVHKSDNLHLQNWECESIRLTCLLFNQALPSEVTLARS